MKQEKLTEQVQIQPNQNRIVNSPHRSALNLLTQ